VCFFHDLRNMRIGTSRAYAEVMAFFHKVLVAAVVALPMLACAGTSDQVGDDADGNAEEEDVSLMADSEELSLPGGWKPSASVRAAGLAQRVTYDGGPAWNPRNCSGGFTRGGRKLENYLMDKFDPEISSIGGYACRRMVGGTKMSLHGTGRALDIMIKTVGSKADNTKGDKVAAFLVRNAEKIGIQYIIWDNAQWRPGRDVRFYGGGSKDPHVNHLHIELTEEAAALQTPFMKTGSLSVQP
jgi:hypothetical protein